MPFNRRRSNQSSPQANTGKRRGSGHRAGFIETLEARQLLSAAATLATPALTQPAVVQSAETTAISASVTGLVTSASGKGIGNVNVFIFMSQSTATGSPLTVTTNSSGQYTFPSVAVGTYMVRAEASGYVGATSAAFKVVQGSNTAPTLVLSQAAIITGTVTDANGVPLVGAEVSIASSAAASTVLGEAKTNSNGQYAFLTLPAGTYIVKGSDTGYAGATSAAFTTVAGSNTAPTLKLTQIVTGSVSGLVTDTNGKPIANASVILLPSPSANSISGLTATTNSSGQYTIPTVPAGMYTVRAEAAGYGSATSAVFSVGQGSNTAPTLVLTQAVVITGTVTDANGVPLAGAGVSLVISGGTTVVASVTTNSSGQYTIQGVPAGSYVVRGAKDGYMSATSASFTVFPGSNAAPTLKLTQIISGSVSGLVTDSNGNPIANASVILIPSTAGASTTGLTAKTNASGQYTIPVVPAGTYMVRAEASGYVSATSAAFTVGQGSNTAPTLVLTQGVTISGTVTDGNGIPLAGAQVLLLPAVAAANATATATTNSSGQYTFSSVPAGSYEVQGTDSGYMSATSAAFTVVPGANTAPTLKLTQIISGSVTGLVTDTNGNPIANASVILLISPTSTSGSLTAKTNSSGQYTIPAVPVGTYTVRAEAAGYGSATSAAFSVGQGSNTAPTLVLGLLVVINGTVTDSNGVPLAGAQVSLLPAVAGTNAIPTVTTNSSGQYTFPSAAAGSYMVRGTDSGYMSATSASFTVVPGPNTAPTLKLTQIVTGSVTGLVTDSNGVSIANASVILIPSPASNSTSGLTTTTNASGQYTFPTAPVGTYMVRAEAAGYGSATSVAFAVVQGANTAPTLVLTQAVVITGTVTDGNGVPLANVAVALLPATAGSTTVAAQTTTNSSGQYTFQGVPAGSYVVRGEKDGYTSATSAPFTVAPGSNTAPTLVLTQAVVITGTVTDGNGVPLANVGVALLPAAAGSTTVVAQSTTNSSGQYTFQGVPAGSYVVRGEKDGYTSATSAPFTVAPGNNTAPTLVLVQIATGTVGGLVTDANGNPIANASVIIFTSPSNTSGSFTTTTNSSGQYTFQTVPVGTYMVRAEATGYAGATSAAFTVSQGSNTAPTLKLTQVITGSVMGLVTDTSGNPISGASVSLTMSTNAGAASSFTATTNASGQYTIPSVPGGTYVVSAQASGYNGAKSAPFTVGQGSNTAPTLQLALHTTLTGTVTNASGTPIAGAKVSIFNALSAGTAPIATFTTNSLGQYSTDSLPPGSYFVTASATGYNSATSAIFMVVAGPNVAPTLMLTVSVTPTTPNT